MSLAPWLLELLACPACRTSVTLLPDGSGLACSSCGRVFPVRDDIPVMLLSEATGPAPGS